MAVQLINVGQIANDGTGDDLREAFIKINQNFEELDLRDDEQTTAINIGSVGEGVFANRVNYELQFKKIVPGSNISLTSTDETITVDAVGGLQQLVIVSDNGSIILADGDSVNIQGGAGIETSVLGNTITITNTSSEIVTDTTPELGGTLQALNNDILGVGVLEAHTIRGFHEGDMEGLVWGLDVREIYSRTLGFDFGTISTNITNILDWFAQAAEIDFGTILLPSTITSDFGSI
jgi:hypothetical protein